MKKKYLSIGFAGLVDFRSIIGQDIVLGINSAAKDFDINIINFISIIRYSFAEDIENYTIYKKKLNYLNLNNIDGLLSLTSSLQYFMTKEEIETFHKSLYPLPVVSIGIPIKDIPSIMNDNQTGIKELMDHLIKVHNYKKIAFIGCKGHIYYNERFNTYKKILQENNIPFDPKLVYIVNDVDSRQQVKQSLDFFLTKRKLRIKKDIEAFVTVSDLIAQKLIEELQNIQINIPNDAAVVGFNNQFNSIRSFPPITTVDPHFFQMGYQSVIILLSVINKKNNLKKFLMPSKLIIRQSCGCFEDQIVNAEIKEHNITINDNKNPIEIFIKEKYNSLILKFNDIINKFDKSLNSSISKELLDSFTNDIISGTSNRFLHSIKKYYFDYKNVTEEKLTVWHNAISEIRNLLLPLFIGNINLTHKAENIFHQVRVMIDLAYSYINYSKKGDVYKDRSMVLIAKEFIVADDIDKIIELINQHIDQIDIKGIYLSIHDEPKIDISKTNMIFAYSKESGILIKNNDLYFPRHQIISRKILPDNIRYSMFFDLLYYNGYYLGYVLYEMGSFNIPIYDTLTAIISPALYKALNKNALLNKNKKLITNEQNIIKITDKNIDMNNKENKHLLNTYKILEYLNKHINEPTNLDEISKELNLSISSLMRKTKQMTGLTIQKLHEKLKIEKAKSLLENKIMNVSEISDYLGYQNQFYFSSVFKKNTGMSPKKWIEYNMK
ncbi:MAG: substrate-binding domain-containing protein [Spirochaetes bacterium]|nr:substrate-binding domain-containing protein [Spirochaetota bacterium]